ncbi:hypothetical protein GIB67_036592 [Kingdonia uniflora]|uniref:Aminotransferase-like plant mobile domain-containing protein n=1 Tax=Kingdonia uniflora TaxID=39325 RepID=A0A7J7MEC6_9MAGN|nr:hypothetical protein GIB67_036592 [Kingdonia uniflora]
MLNDEREDPSHPNYNNSPRIPVKRVKTCSTRVPVRDFTISGSVSRVSVTPEEDSSQDFSVVESSSYDSQAGGQGISFSLKKIVDFFAGKVGTNAPQAASSSSSPIKLSSRMVGKAYMLYILGSFLFLTKKGIDVSVKYLSFFQDKDVNKPWSWGAVTLAHLHYSLGALSRVNAKGLACCTTLLESWIFEHFPKLPGILTPNQSGAAEFCTRWFWTKTTSAQSGSAALNMFREALDSYKLQDVIWDPYLEKREDKHNFKEVASFTVSFTKLCPYAVNFAKDDDYDDERVLRDRGGVSQRENAEVPHSQNEGDGGPGETGECAFFMEANLRMQADIQAKDVANSICEKKLDEKGVWRLALKGAIEGGDFKDTEDPIYEELSRQFTKLLTIAQQGPMGKYKDDIILSGRGEYQERIDSRLKKTDHKTNLRQTLFQPFNWFQLDIRDVERDGNTTFRVPTSYAYQSQMKFLNVKDSLCTLMTKKPYYWKNVFQLEVRCSLK